MSCARLHDLSQGGEWDTSLAPYKSPPRSGRSGEPLTSPSQWVLCGPRGSEGKTINIGLTGMKRDG